MSRPHDVAVYAPFAAPFYGARPNDTRGGGAELQTSILCRELARLGLRTAHIIFPVPERRATEAGEPTLVERPHWRGGPLRPVREATAIWRSLAKADARVHIVRGSGGHLIAAAGYCRARQRRLVFSASSDLDFDLERPDRAGHTLGGYARSVRSCDRLVVQTGQQRDLAHSAFPGLDPVIIPSFSQPTDQGASGAEYFLWADRLVGYKRPECYLELAQAVPEAKFHMVLVPTNETDPELAERIRSRAAAITNLELLPPRPRDQLMAEVSRAAAVVTTSRVEGMPNTFLEAWARGVPVLSLSVDPDARIADHGTGIFAEGSMERLVHGARSLWSEPALRMEIGARAREFVRSVHSPEAVAERWAELLGPLLSSR